MKIITGNPGTGKHTIARRVARNLDLDLVDISKVAIEGKIFEKKDRILEIDVDKLKKNLRKIITNKSLLVGHLAPYVVSRNKANIAVVLRSSPYKLESVYKKRKYSIDKSRENLGSEILGITYYDTLKNIGQNKTFQFDTTDRSIASVTKKIESLFQKNHMKGDSVDWLALVLKKGDLQRFFPY